MRVAVGRSSYFARDPPIRRRRKYCVRFDPRPTGHNHGIGHGRRWVFLPNVRVVVEWPIE